MMELQQAVEAVKRLSHAFPGTKLTPENVQAYAIRLAPYQQATVDEACERIIYRMDRFPSIAAMVAVVAELEIGEPDVTTAWTEVRRAIGRYGRYGVPKQGGGYTPVTFSHPTIAAVVDAMGWRELCDSENEVADRAHFMKLYESSSRKIKRTVSEVAAPALASGPSWRHSGTQDAEALGPVIMRQALPQRIER